MSSSSGVLFKSEQVARGLNQTKLETLNGELSTKELNQKHQRSLYFDSVSY